MMAHQIDVIPDDVSITRGLLGRPHVPPHGRTSFTSTTRSANTEDISSDPEEGISFKVNPRRGRAIQGSNTWTSSSGEILSDKDDIEDRTFFVLEYNRLGTKHGVRPLISEDSDIIHIDINSTGKKSGTWFSRKILRRISSSQNFKHKHDGLTKRRRSISDLSLRLKSKGNTFKDKDLQELVRLCGLSLVYLPTEYAISSLAVPTCFRATAQYLIQNAFNARGVFRIPGSHNIVAALYNHYCTMDDHGAVVSGTVRCPTLPEHIKCDVHDVASAFKKFISGLPGGILGSLSLFDAFISIQGQFNSSPELTRTKQSRIRARLIALAIWSLRSQYRRDLICAVFGLLSMIGRNAEITPRENERGQPLPTSDLMGYNCLGIVFGPLLLGDLLENYTMQIPNIRRGLVLLPVSPLKSRKERYKSNKTSEECSALSINVDKVKVANSIAEMLITHWRDVVRHMKNMKVLKTMRSSKSLDAATSKQPFLRPCASESFAMRKMPDWDNDGSPVGQTGRYESPTPRNRGGRYHEAGLNGPSSPKPSETLTVRKQRLKARPMSSQKLSGARSMSILSPTKEENLAESPDSGLRFSCEPASAVPAQPPEGTQPFLHARRASSSGMAGPLETASLQPLVKIASPPTVSNISDYSGLFKDILHNTPKKTQTHTMSVAVEPSLLLTEAIFKDSPAPLELKNCASTMEQKPQKSSIQEHELKDCTIDVNSKASVSHTKPKHFLEHATLAGPCRPGISNPHPPHGDITLSIVPSPGETRFTDIPSRRTSASEPGLLRRCPPNQPTARSIRHSKTSFLEPDLRNTAEKWRRSKDPLGKISVTDDLASLVTLALVLEEECPEIKLGSLVATNQTGKEYDSITKQTIEDVLPRLIQEMEEAKSILTNEECDFIYFAREVIFEYRRGALEKAKYEILRRRLRELMHREVSLKAQSSGPMQTSLERPPVIPGMNYNHHSWCALSPPKKGIDQYFGMVKSPATVREQNVVVQSTESVSADVQVGNSQLPSSQSPRLSVRALAARFNLGDPASITVPSPTKSLSHDGTANIGPCSESPEKIVAPYTTNSPSPAKSQKSSISDTSIRSLRLPPSVDRLVTNIAPPRKLPISDLKGPMPSCSPNRRSTLLAPDSFAYYSSGLPARLSLYDGPAVQVSALPSPVVTSRRVIFEASEAARPTNKAIALANVAEVESVQIAINPFANPPPSRSNSLLHTQVRNLQQQLSTRTEEVHHLKRQLSTRDTLGMGALSEELREAKREIRIWRNRAEVAEKQAELMAALSRWDSTSYAAAASSSIAAENFIPTPSRTIYSEEGTVVANRIQRALHGMDGARSPPNASECSTDTVVRDVVIEDTGPVSWDTI